jgi:hypothetical protein
MKDPRAENCRDYAEVDGKVVGCKLTYKELPSSTYELAKVSMVDEAAASGQTVATVSVVDRDGLPAPVYCYLAFPWHSWEFPSHFENALLPGNPNVPYQHMITNKYNPSTDEGPLAIFVGDKQGNVLSDVICGLGLPAGRHVCYQLVFRERGAQRAEPSLGPEPQGDATAALARIEEKLDRIARHLGLEG